MPPLVPGVQPPEAEPSREWSRGHQELDRIHHEVWIRLQVLYPEQENEKTALDRCTVYVEHFTLNRAWMPFSAACSSNRFFSSGLRFPAFSAAWIWSKTALSSIAARRVDTLQEQCQIRSGTLDKQEWRTSHWIRDIFPGHCGTNLQHRGMSGSWQDDVLL